MPNNTDYQGEITLKDIKAFFLQCAEMMHEDVKDLGSHPLQMACHYFQEAASDLESIEYYFERVGVTL